MRFFGFHPHLSATEVGRFTTVDHCDREAFVVVVESEIVGVGRYDRLRDTTSAEVAFATRDDHQGLGIARVLFAELATAAHGVGITQFVAETLPENHKMLGVFTGTGLVSSRTFGSGVVDVTMSLVDSDGKLRVEPSG